MPASASFLPALLFSRPLRACATAFLCATFSGCASLKEMTADFDRKWDDPKSILAEMDETSAQNRAAATSADEMAAFNANDCAGKFKLLDARSDEATLATRRISAGECLLDAGKDKSAVSLFDIVLEEGANAVALQGKGVALIRLGRYDEGAAVLQSAIDLDPSLWRAWNAFGVAADYRGAKEAAWAAFAKAAGLNPTDGAALNNLGVSQMKAGLHEEAVASFKLALALEGARDAAEANLRLAYALQGDYASSVKALPENRRAVALNNAGVAAASRGDAAEARRLFMKALDESPHFYAKAYNNLSLLIE